MHQFSYSEHVQKTHLRQFLHSCDGCGRGFWKRADKAKHRFDALINFFVNFCLTYFAYLSLLTVSVGKVCKESDVVPFYSSHANPGRIAVKTVVVLFVYFQYYTILHQVVGR